MANKKNLNHIKQNNTNFHQKINIWLMDNGQLTTRVKTSAKTKKSFWATLYHGKDVQHTVKHCYSSQIQLSPYPIISAAFHYLYYPRQKHCQALNTKNLSIQFQNIPVFRSVSSPKI